MRVVMKVLGEGAEEHANLIMLNAQHMAGRSQQIKLQGQERSERSRYIEELELWRYSMYASGLQWDVYFKSTANVISLKKITTIFLAMECDIHLSYNSSYQNTEQYHISVLVDILLCIP